jgi:2-polyprenyl-3-methyl-5-hydroxy-6-metoxy-1,4-benzoquinol methylase
MAARSQIRDRAFGEENPPSVLDRLGVWLNISRIQREAGALDGRSIADVGCGYRAVVARTLAQRAASVTVVDVALDPELSRLPRVHAFVGPLPTVLANIKDSTQDITLCINVLEHLWEPEATVAELRRITAPGGSVLINVPSWMGKRFLELAAFRLGLAPVEEMQDHKMYYDPRDLWPLLVRSGFRPDEIRCFRHKFGLNTFARCRVARV